MTDLKISGLTDGSPIATNDMLAIARAGTSFRVSWDPTKQPGGELNYTQITTPVNITDTSEATASALISPGAITFDGAPVIVEFFGICSAPTAAVSNTLQITLFEGSTEITRLAQMRSAITANPNLETLYARYRFTPTAGAHTYKICGFVSSTTGTPNIAAGAGGTGNNPPAFVRFSKV